MADNQGWFIPIAQGITGAVDNAGNFVRDLWNYTFNTQTKSQGITDISENDKMAQALFDAGLVTSPNDGYLYSSKTGERLTDSQIKTAYNLLNTQPTYNIRYWLDTPQAFNSDYTMKTGWYDSGGGVLAYDPNISATQGDNSGLTTKTVNGQTVTLWNGEPISPNYLTSDTDNRYINIAGNDVAPDTSQEAYQTWVSGLSPQTVDYQTALNYFNQNAAYPVGSDPFYTPTNQDILNYYNANNQSSTPSYNEWLGMQPSYDAGISYNDLTDAYKYVVDMLGIDAAEQMSPQDVLNYYLAANPTQINPGNTPNAPTGYTPWWNGSSWQMIEDPSYIDPIEQANLDYMKWQREQDLWNQKWSLAQNPNSPQPSGFAGWGMDYEWSPSAYMSGGQGWMTSPMSAEEMNNPYLYGSGAWAQAGENWWDVSRINQMLSPTEQQYGGLVPGVVAQYFTGIEPYMNATDITPTYNYGQGVGPYQLSATPTWGTIQNWSPYQYGAMQSAYENLDTNIDWNQMLKNSYAASPPGASGFSGLNYYR